MKIIELLKKIENKEIKNGAIFHGGDLFYRLIVIDKNLYVINEITKNLSLLESGYIGNFIVENYEFYEYKKIIS